MAYAVYFSATEMTSALPYVADAAAVMYLIVTAARVVGWQKSIPEKQPILAVTLVLIAVVANAAFERMP